jgi:hypothetical protein
VVYQQTLKVLSNHVHHSKVTINLKDITLTLKAIDKQVISKNIEFIKAEDVKLTPCVTHIRCAALLSTHNFSKKEGTPEKPRGGEAYIHWLLFFHFLENMKPNAWVRGVIGSLTADKTKKRYSARSPYENFSEKNELVRYSKSADDFWRSRYDRRHGVSAYRNFNIRRPIVIAESLRFGRCHDSNGNICIICIFPVYAPLLYVSQIARSFDGN